MSTSDQRIARSLHDQGVSEAIIQKATGLVPRKYRPTMTYSITVEVELVDQGTDEGDDVLDAALTGIQDQYGEYAVSVDGFQT